MIGAPAGDRRAGLPQGIILMMPCIFAVMGTAVLAPVLPLMMVEFADVPRATFWVPALLTAPSICIALLSPWAGILCDMVSRRKLVIAALVLYALVGLAPMLLTSFNAVLASRVMLGVFEAGLLVLMNALIADYFDGAQRERWLSMQGAVASVAALGLLPLGGLAGSLYGWRGPFIMYGLAAPVAFLLTKLTWEVPRQVPSPSENPDRAPFPIAWMTAFCCLAVLIGMLWFSVQTQIGLGLAATGVKDPGTIGILASIALLGMPLGAVIFMRITHLSLNRLLLIELTLAGATLIGLAYARQPGTFVAFAFLHVLSNGLMLPTAIVHLMRRLPPGVRGRGVGLYQSAIAVGQFLSSVAMSMLRGSGTVLDSFGRLGTCTLAVAAGVLLWGIVAGRSEQRTMRPL